VLLVSGGGKKRAFDALAALRHLAALRAGGGGGGSSVSSSSGSGSRGSPPPPAAAKRRRAAAGGGANTSSGSGDNSGGGGGGGGGNDALPAWPPLCVAFNPYLPDASEREAERLRLRDKVATGLVAGVYLQVGGGPVRVGGRERGAGPSCQGAVPLGRRGRSGC
jgi:hypothetical protein